MSGQAAFADFFPAAPAVIAQKEAERAARERSLRQQHHHEQNRRRYADERSGFHDVSRSRSTASGTGIAAAVGSTSTTTTTTTLAINTTLTPASNPSPPSQATPPESAKATELGSQASAISSFDTAKEPPTNLLTPKATPPVIPQHIAMMLKSRSNPGSKNYRIMRDTFIEGRPSEPIIYRHDGEGLEEPVVDPRLAILDYFNGPKVGRRKLYTSLDRARWVWDKNYIGPGPPSQILIHGFSPLLTEHEILTHFRVHGDIQKSQMMTDPATCGSLGLCTIIYRDSRSKHGPLGHQAARAAVRMGNVYRIGMETVNIELDRDGMKCASMTKNILDEKERKFQEEDARRVRETAQSRPPPPEPVQIEEPRPPQPQTRAHDRGLPRALEHYTLPDEDYCALEDVGRRPAIYISEKWVPPDEKFKKHFRGRLINYRLSNIYVDRTGWYLVFRDISYMEDCFKRVNGDRLFSYKMVMKTFPHGNPNFRRSETPGEPDRPLPKLDLVAEITDTVLDQLRTATLTTVRKRIAETLCFDQLDPNRQYKRLRSTPKPIPTAPKALLRKAPPLISRFDVQSPRHRVAGTSVPTPTEALTPPTSFAPPAVTAVPVLAPPEPPKEYAAPKKITHLPTFKRKRKIATPQDARPLTHFLNEDGIISDDGKTPNPNRESRDASFGLEDESMVESRVSGKRKRAHSKLGPTVLDDDLEMSEAGAQSSKSEFNDFIVDSEDEKLRDKAKKKRAKLAALRRMERENQQQKMSTKRSRKAVVEDEEDAFIDLVGDDNTPTPSALSLSIPISKPKKSTGSKPEPINGLKRRATTEEVQVQKDQDEEMYDYYEKITVEDAEYPWAQSTATSGPMPCVDDADDIILDLDGMQNLVQDDEDLKFLRKALEGEDRAAMGNVYAWACDTKEAKKNRRGVEGVTCDNTEKIEGFYRPNKSGCARTEGYRKIPESEKSQYLPHRIAVAAKRAAGDNPEKRNLSNVHAQPASSSRANRVNNRRLVAELNNQKQILSSDADVLRFNQLKKRKKPVRFARSKIHNWGLYAMEKISANDMIIEYVGEIIRQQVADLRERNYLKSGIGSSYLFRIDENTVIDATKKGGIARFINHSCTPNCTAKIIKVDGTKRIVIYALRDIAEQEELTYDYKFERELDSDDRIPCLCGTINCKGFLN